jgi:hypothetical protein
MMHIVKKKNEIRRKKGKKGGEKLFLECIKRPFPLLTSPILFFFLLACIWFN